jgi:hypothetical protein
MNRDAAAELVEQIALFAKVTTISPSDLGDAAKGACGP